MKEITEKDIQTVSRGVTLIAGLGLAMSNRSSGKEDMLDETVDMVQIAISGWLNERGIHVKKESALAGQEPLTEVVGDQVQNEESQSSQGEVTNNVSDQEQSGNPKVSDGMPLP